MQRKVPDCRGEIVAAGLMLACMCDLIVCDETAQFANPVLQMALALILVTGAALGTSALYDRLADLPIEFRPASYTHAPSVLSQLRNLVAINSAIEVDLTGQVGAETRGESYVGAVGGQVDFCRAASLTGGRSIIALRSTSRGESTIKATLDFGSVTTARADVDFVVTEHGVASLRGVGLAERARRLTAVAAPEHRELLERSLTLTDCAS